MGAFPLDGFLPEQPKKERRPMKVEISVPEVVSVFEEIQAQPEKVQDIDFLRKEILVREGKGAKDGVITMSPGG